ncbi:MAG TPA: hypothetical protein VN018_09810 [Brevundimonas sp.]|nr:hypothetical protein [Brevundimonas sp.]
MAKWGATILIWLVAPFAGMAAFTTVAELTSGRIDLSVEELIFAGLALLWLAAAILLGRHHHGRARVVHILGCLALSPLLVLLFFYSFL